MVKNIIVAIIFSGFSGHSAFANDLEQAATELAAAALLATQGDEVLAYQRLQYFEHSVPNCFDEDLLNGHTYVWRLFDRAGWIVMDDDPIRATRANQGAAQAAQEANDRSICSEIVDIYENYMLEQPQK